MSSTAAEALRIAALRFGGRAHIIDRDRARSFAELDAAADQVAAALRRRELPPGARIALRIGNSFAGVAAAFGVWRAGGILVPLNPRLTASEERTIAELSGARLAGSVGDDPSALEIEERTEADDIPVAGDVAAVAFTSGTTGKPKGVEITHANLLWSAAAVMHTRRDWHDSVAAVVSPICHLPVFVSHYLARLLSGGT
ncbi:MAG: AMP-binding protein, partial [Candidatus Binatia bacterium]